MDALSHRIAIDPETCGGKPRIAGTRVWVALIVDLLADGLTEADLLEQYPQLTHEDIIAALDFARSGNSEMRWP